MLRSCLAVLLLVTAALGQISSTSSSVTTTASVNQNLPPDQVTFVVTLESGFAITLDDLVAALKGTGLSATNFVGVNSSNQLNAAASGGPAAMLDWYFQIAVPFSGMKTETNLLTVFQANLAQARSPVKLAYSLGASQTSTQALVQSCSLSDLVSAARSQAKDLAAAANLKLGNVTAATTSVSTQIGPAAAAPYIVPACNLTMTFGLGQNAPNTITVSAMRSVNAPPDQATIIAYVDTPENGTLTDALAVLSGTGVTAANLSDVGKNYSQPGLEWRFSLQVPLSKLKDTLAAFQKAPGVWFSVQSTQMSVELLASQDCTKTALVADAQAHARRVAAAARVSLNGILTISDGYAGSGTYSYIGVFDPISSGASLNSLMISPQPSCSVTVQFGIGQ
jgi:uncharacterized protein YggE